MTNQAPDYFNCAGDDGTPIPPPPTPVPTNVPGPNLPKTNVLVQVRMDAFPTEIGWRIVDPITGAVEIQRSPGTYFLEDQVVQETVSVTEGGNYILDMFDQAGDGICCDYGFGEASVFLGTSADPNNRLAYTDGRYLGRLQLPFTASSAGIDSGSTPSLGLFLIRFQTDSFPTESSFEIRALNGELVWYGDLIESAPGAEAIFIVELTLGESYKFYVFDAGGNGLCKLLHTCAQCCCSMLDFANSPSCELVLIRLCFRFWKCVNLLRNGD